MSTTDLSTITEIANSITVIGLLLFFILAISRGWVVTNGRFQDCLSNKTEIEKNILELENQLVETTKKYDRLITFVMSAIVFLPIIFGLIMFMYLNKNHSVEL